MESCAAGGMALWAYGAAAGGVTFDTFDREVIALDRIPMRQHLDGLLAAAFDRERDYYARYPADRPTSVEPVKVVARLLE